MEYAFPGAVLFLKFLFRNGVGRAFEWATFCKSILSLPIDLSFLGLSYAAISMSQAQNASHASLDARTALTLFSICIGGLIVQQIISKAAEDHFDQAKYVVMALLAFVAYGLAVAILIGTSKIGGVV